MKDEKVGKSADLRQRTKPFALCIIRLYSSLPRTVVGQLLEGKRMKDEKDGEPANLRQRTKAFALRIIRLYSSLPRIAVGQILGKQVFESGTSVGAQYREAVRSRSDAEFISKIESALQELEETAYWLELLSESGVVKPSRLSNLQQETDELTAILVTCAKKAKQRRKP